MTENQVTMTTLRQHLGDLVNRVAYGNERIILISRGEPRAAIISVAELERLQELDSIIEREEAENSLRAAARVQERIRIWQERHDVPAGDTVTDLNKLRKERNAKLSDMH